MAGLLAYKFAASGGYCFQYGKAASNPEKARRAPDEMAVPLPLVRIAPPIIRG